MFTFYKFLILWQEHRVFIFNPCNYIVKKISFYLQFNDEQSQDEKEDKHCLSLKVMKLTRNPCLVFSSAFPSNCLILHCCWISLISMYHSVSKIGILEKTHVIC